MNDTELDKILRAAAPPERPEEYWEGFPRQIESRLGRPSPAPRALRRVAPRFAWAVAIALACVFAGYLIGQRAGRTNAAAEGDRLLQNRKFIQELTGMFPERVRAIVNDESGVHLVLSEKADVPASAPIWLKVCRGRSCTTVVTFSGQELQIAGQDLTVLTDAENRVILAGERFAWTSSGAASGPSDLKIQARALEFALK